MAFFTREVNRALAQDVGATALAGTVGYAGAETWGGEGNHAVGGLAAAGYAGWRGLKAHSAGGFTKYASSQAVGRNINAGIRTGEHHLSGEGKSGAMHYAKEMAIGAAAVGVGGYGLTKAIGEDNYGGTGAMIGAAGGMALASANMRFGGMKGYGRMAQFKDSGMFTGPMSFTGPMPQPKSSAPAGFTGPVPSAGPVSEPIIMPAPAPMLMLPGPKYK